MKREYNVSLFPEPFPENPYLHLLATSLEEQGMSIVRNNLFTCRWLIKNRKKVGVLHFHFLEGYYYSPKLSVAIRRTFYFLCRSLIARLLGYKIVWTVHNLFPLPGELKYPKIDYVIRRIITFFATSLIVHCEYAKRQVQKKFYRSWNIYVIHHGNYLNWYENNKNREKSREKLGLSNDAFVYLAFGMLRPYSDLDILLEGFKKLTGNEVLVIAGKPMDSEMHERVKRLTKDIGNVKCVLEFIPDDEIQTYFNACDVIVMHYSEILTSGTLILALSFGKPVIAPKVGCIPEAVDDSIGVLYEVGDYDQFYDSLKEIKSRDLKSMGEEAFKRAQQLDWEAVAKKHIRAYRGE